MAINLMQLAEEVLGNKQTLSLLGKVLGADEAQTKSAVSMAGPALMGSLIKKAATPSGAGDLFRSLKDVDENLAGNLGSLLTGGGLNLDKVTEMGGKLVGGLLGGQSEAVAAVLARLTGMNGKTIMSLLGMLLPVLLSVVKRQVKAQSLDEKGFANLLTGQKDFLAGKIPSELSGVMGLADLAGGIKNAAAGKTPAPAPATPGLGKMLWPLLLLAALALAYAFWPSGDGAKKGAAPGPGTADTTGGVDVPDPLLSSVTDGLTEALTGLTTEVGSVTDETSARSFIEKVQAAQTAIDGMKLPSLDSDTKSALGGTLRPLLEKLRAGLEVAYKIPGVQAIVEPAIKPLLDTLTAVSG